MDLSNQPVIAAGQPALSLPVDVAVRTNPSGHDEIWISDAAQGKVVVLDRNLSYRSQITLPGIGPPRIAFNSNKTILFAVIGNSLSTIGAASSDTSGTPPAIQTSINGLAGVSAIASAGGNRVRVVPTGNGGYEMLEYDFDAVNPSSFIQIGSPMGLPSSFVWDPRFPKTIGFLSENDSTLYCPEVSGRGSGKLLGLTLRTVLELPVPIPPSVDITVNTSPSGRAFKADLTGYSGAHVFPWRSQSTHQLAVASPQVSAPGVRHRFTSWSDGNTSLVRTITIPPAPAIYTANFSTEYLLSINAGSIGITVNPPSPTNDGYYPSGTLVTITATPDPPGSMVSFTGANSQLGNTASVTMNAPRNVSASQGTPVNFTTQGAFGCGPRSGVEGCGTDTINASGVLLKYAGESLTQLVGTTANTRLGRLIVACANQTGACSSPDLNAAAITLRITITQSAPVAGNGPINVDGSITGAPGGLVSTGQINWSPMPAFVDLPRIGGTYRYEILMTPLTIAPASTNNCGAGCPLPGLASSLDIGGKITAQ